MKVAILGKLQSKLYAPFWEKDWEIWGCNKHIDFDILPRYTRWFDIHRNPQQYPEIPQDKLILRDEKFIEWCKEQLDGNYINSSFAYMMMYALKEGFTEISLYGCGFYSEDEIRKKQKENVRELIFYLKGKGTKVYSFEKSLTEEYKVYG